MVLKTVGVAGTLESSDAMITVEPANQGGIVIDVSSSVKRQFGRQIEETVLNTIKELGVENANVKVVDKGALNYALIARTKAAVYLSLIHIWMNNHTITFIYNYKIIIFIDDIKRDILRLNINTVSYTHLESCYVKIFMECTRRKGRSSKSKTNFRRKEIITYGIYFKSSK